METFAALLAFCAGNSPVPGEFPTHRPVTRSFDVFFGLPLNKQLGKQSWGWWFETPSRSLWRQCDAMLQKQWCWKYYHGIYTFVISVAARHEIKIMMMIIDVWQMLPTLNNGVIVGSGTNMLQMVFSYRHWTNYLRHRWLSRGSVYIYTGPVLERLNLNETYFPPHQLTI